MNRRSYAITEAQMVEMANRLRAVSGDRAGEYNPAIMTDEVRQLMNAARFGQVRKAQVSRTWHRLGEALLDINTELWRNEG